ncbi:unnamed protein product [Albugo candida]|uniref:Uncharacterized protein n=1 Tax=Albugo candida TaxID=65357 RepID=A0A024GJ96_9STRA|nr:unnamed protein product [Albugo candida]|eukprot:CCI46597.1 unnamed protein product [Albugo candida]
MSTSRNLSLRSKRIYRKSTRTTHFDRAFRFSSNSTIKSCILSAITPSHFTKYTFIFAYSRVIIDRKQSHARVVGADHKTLSFWIELDTVHLLVCIHLIENALSVE